MFNLPIAVFNTAVSDPLKTWKFASLKRLHHSSIQSSQLLPLSIRVKYKILTKAFQVLGDLVWSARPPTCILLQVWPHFLPDLSFLLPLQPPCPLCSSLNKSSYLWDHMTNSLTSFHQVFSIKPIWPPYLILQPASTPTFPILLTQLPSYLHTTYHLTRQLVYVHSYLSAHLPLTLKYKIHRARTFYKFRSLIHPKWLVRRLPVSAQ